MPLLDALPRRLHPDLQPLLPAGHRRHEVPLHRPELVGQEGRQQQVLLISMTFFPLPPYIALIFVFTSQMALLPLP